MRFALCFSPRRAAIAVLLGIAALLSACEEPEVYPVSGERCEEGDPVRSLDASDCLPPG